jgi:hypothetical protein
MPGPGKPRVSFIPALLFTPPHFSWKQAVRRQGEEEEEGEIG